MLNDPKFLGKSKLMQDAWEKNNVKDLKRKMCALFGLVILLNPGNEETSKMFKAW